VQVNQLHDVLSCCAGAAATICTLWLHVAAWSCSCRHRCVGILNGHAVVEHLCGTCHTSAHYLLLLLLLSLFFS
jgi:hypothetical protein